MQEAPNQESRQEQEVSSSLVVRLARDWQTKILTTAVVFALLLLGFRFTHDLNADRLLRENDRLHRDLESALTHVTQLRQSVDSLHVLDQEIRQLAKLEPISDEVRRMGVGGALYEPVVVDVGDLALDQLKQLDREAQLLRTSLGRAREQIVLMAERAGRIPSILPIKNGDRSSAFGYREDPFSGRYRMHEGVDFQAPTGTPVLAPGAGRVVETGRDSGFGIIVRLDHGNGIQTLYAHLSRSRVKVGQQVERGQHIGDVGSTGRSTSSHLHYEVHVQGRPVNPEPYMMDELANLR